MDQITDKNMAGIYKISRITELPEFVKEAAERDYSTLAREHFADDANRQYPIDTPEDVWKSWCYYQKFAAQKSAAVEERIRDRAVFFDVELPVLAETVTTTAPAVTIKYAYEGVVHAETPVNDMQDLNKIAADLTDNRARYPFRMRQNVAKQVLSTAKVFGGRLPGEREVAMQKMACYGAGSLLNALEVFNLRKEALHRAGFKLDDITEGLQKQACNGVIPPEVCEKLACFADACDRLVGLHRKYGHGITPPEDKLVTVTLRDMDNLEQHTVKIANHYVTADVASQPQIRGLIESLSGQKLAEDRLLSALRDLPPEHQRLVGRVLS